MNKGESNSPNGEEPAITSTTLRPGQTFNGHLTKAPWKKDFMMEIASNKNAQIEVHLSVTKGSL